MGSRAAVKAYIRRYYREYNDAQLARALGVATTHVTQLRKKLKLERARENLDAIRDSGEREAPGFDGRFPVPRHEPIERVRDFLPGAIVAGFALAIYVICLPPTVTGEDSGELIAAARTLGIAHPPGYPLWSLSAHFFSYVPDGAVAWRIALSSAVFGSLAVFLTYLITLRLTASQIASVATGATLAFSQQFWAQSIIAEVYALNALLISLCCLLLVKWYQSRSNRTLYVFAAVYGLSLGNHNTTLMLGPVFVAFVLLIDRSPLRRWRLYATCTSIALSMLLVYLYLPLRSMADPPVDWGDPENFRNFWDVVTRKQYAFAFTDDPRTVSRILAQLGVFLHEYSRQFTPWLAWLPLVGLGVAWRRDKFIFVLFALAFFAMSVGFVLVTNFDVDKQSVWLNSVFWIPSYIVAAVLLGFGVDWIAKLRVNGRALGRAIAVVLAVCVGVIPLIGHFKDNDKSEYYFAGDYGMNILATLEKDAILFPTADHATFPVLYLQAVEGKRPDVTIGDKYGYPEKHLYADMPPIMLEGFRKIPSDPEVRLIENWIISQSDRPIYFTKKRDMSDLPGASIVSAGLLYRVVREGETFDPPDYWDMYAWHTLDVADARGEFSAELILADYRFARGRALLAEGRREEGLAALEMALAITGEDRESLNNYGSAAAEHGALAAARGYLERATVLDPEYPTALRNLARVYMQQGEAKLAAMTVERLVELDQADYESLWLSTDALRAIGRSSDALRRMEEMTRLNPEDAKLFREIGLIYLNERQESMTAHRYLTRSLALDPSQIDLLEIVNDPLRGGPNQPTPIGPQPPGLPTLPGVTPPGPAQGPDQLPGVGVAPPGPQGQLP